MIARMPDRMREAFTLFRFEERPQRDIAEQMGITVSAVEKLLRRAYQFLQENRHARVRIGRVGVVLTVEGAGTSDAEEQAIDWHVRQRDMSAAEWDAFATWLEDSPANARAYDAVAMADALLVAPGGRAATHRDPKRRWRPTTTGGGVVGG